MSVQLDGARVIITGAAGGLGRQLVTSFAACGSRVALVDFERTRGLTDQRDAAVKLGATDALAIGADVTNTDAISALGREVVAAWGGIDVLINNAAINRVIPFTDVDALTDEVWALLLESVLTGPFRCSREIGTFMKRNGGGAIVSITSLAGLAPRGSSIAYSVGKAGLIHLTRCLAVALGPEVTVNSVAPGLMRSTSMGAELNEDAVRPIIEESALKAPVRVEDVAEQVLALVRSQSTTGQNILVDSGLMYR
jgi:3-oxoacyl-[acyl-carrier protein] reductase